GGSGDVSMYVAVDRIPSAGDHDGFSARRGNTETVRFTAPVSGTYYILLSGSYTGLTLVARQ
uniref:PPC domain-containing protein n=1 Tax=Luteimonas huabeiensis TaxID=1244513 RepID=UPI0005BE7C8B